MSSLLPRGPLAAALLVVMCALSACGGPDARRASHMQRGEKYLADGNLAKAQIEFRNALQIAPNNAEARFMAGLVAEKLNNVRDAAGLYQAAIEADPAGTRARARLGRLYVLANLPDKALDTVQPALQQHPEDADLLSVRGAARAEHADRAGALADAEHAVRVAPLNENAVALLSSLYQSGGESQRAIDLLRTTVEHEPTSTDLRQILASLYERLGQPALAEGQLQKLVELRPEELAYRYQLALFYGRAKRLDDADKVLRAAIAAKPSDDRPKLAYAEFETSTRSPADGERALTEFLKTEPNDYDLRLALAAVELRAGHAEEALATYRDVIARADQKPQGFTARDRTAALLLQRGSLDEASKLVGQVLDKSPRDAEALAVRAAIALARHDPAGAIADLRAVLRDQPRSVAVLRDLARAYIENAQPALAEESLRSAMDAAPKDSSVRIELAQLLVGTGRLDDAVKLLGDSAQALPADVPTREALARVYLAKPDFAAAARVAEELKSIAPQRAIGFYLAGLAAEGQKHPDEAQAQFERALGLQSDAMDVITAVTRLQVAQGHAPDAIARVTALLAKEPNNASASELLGELYLASKDNPHAIEQLTRTTRIAPKWWPGYRGLGSAQAVTGDVSSALHTYEQGIASAGEVPALVVDLATLYERQGRIDDAIHAYEALRKEDPHSQLASNNLAMLLITYKTDRGSLDRARDLTAGFGDSGNAQLIDTEGWVRFKRGETAQALTELEKAAAKTSTGAPNADVLYYHLGMAQFKAGERDKARASLEAALGGAKKFTGVDEARSVLAQINGHPGPG